MLHILLTYIMPITCIIDTVQDLPPCFACLLSAAHEFNLGYHQLAASRMAGNSGGAVAERCQHAALRNNYFYPVRYALQHAHQSGMMRNRCSSVCMTNRRIWMIQVHHHKKRRSNIGPSHIIPIGVSARCPLKCSVWLFILFVCEAHLTGQLEGTG